MYRILRYVFPALFATLVTVGFASSANAGVSISIALAPPPLPVYVLPAVPAPNYIWAPGYWAYGDDDYYWVPGTWVLAPRVGYLWTPGYWGWREGFYVWNAGYWGPHIGYYGGINYGHGYFGAGYEGGRWDHGNFFYNTAITHVNTTVIHNTYVNSVTVKKTVNNVSFNGGNGGVTAQPTPQKIFGDARAARRSDCPADAARAYGKHQPRSLREDKRGQARYSRHSQARCVYRQGRCRHEGREGDIHRLAWLGLPSQVTRCRVAGLHHEYECDNGQRSSQHRRPQDAQDSWSRREARQCSSRAEGSASSASRAEAGPEAKRLIGNGGLSWRARVTNLLPLCPDSGVVRSSSACASKAVEVAVSCQRPLLAHPRRCDWPHHTSAEWGEADVQRISSDLPSHFFPTASAIHFFIWLSRAAPERFLDLLPASHAAAASSSHFFMKLIKAAPASFFSAALAVHDASASALPPNAQRQTTTTRYFIYGLHPEELDYRSKGHLSLCPRGQFVVLGSAASRSAPCPPQQCSHLGVTHFEPPKPSIPPSDAASAT